MRQDLGMLVTPAPSVPRAPSSASSARCSCSTAQLGPILGGHVRDHRHQRASSASSIPNIAWQAHLGGLVTGAAAAAVIAATSSRERRAWQWPGLALVAAVLVVASVAKYALTSGVGA